MLKAVRDVQRRGFKYVLYLQEDMWITEPLTGAVLEQFVDLMDYHRIDALKLADLADPPPEMDELGRVCRRLGEQGLASRVRWFGAHPYVFSHHTTIFRVEFLMEALYVAVLFRRVSPLQQEQFCSAYLKVRSVAADGDGGRYRVATFADEPLVSYVHASGRGELTPEAESVLEELGLQDLYDSGLQGEVFPWRRSEM